VSNAGAAVSDTASSAGDAASNAGHDATNAAGDAASAGSGLIKLLLPLLFWGTLIFGVWQLLPMLTGTAGDVTDGAGSLVESAKAGTSDMVDGPRVPWTVSRCLT